MRPGGSAGNPAAALDALHVVLDHLSSRHGDPQLCRVAVRGLHRTCQQLQAAACATLRHLRLDLYYKGMCALHRGSWSPLLPLGLLAACPGVTSWVLHPRQLSAFTADTVQQLAAAASRLKRVQVTALPLVGYGRQERPGTATDTQLAGLGRLLWAATGLEHVDMGCEGPSPWLMMDPDSSSWDTAKAPPLPLRSWKSVGGLHSVLPHWADKQQQLSSTLSKVDMEGFGGTLYDVSALSALKGMQDLRLNKVNLMSPEALTALISLTRLEVPGTLAAVEAACSLTGLRALSLCEGVDQLFNTAYAGSLPSSISALKQLQCLELQRLTRIRIPAEAGDWLPALEQLVAPGHCLKAVPEGLTRLKQLRVMEHGARELPTTLTSLKELAVCQTHGTLESITGLSNQLGLESLVVTTSGDHSSSMAVLGALTNLRRLCVNAWRDGAFSSFTVLENLKQLTRLDLGGRVASAACKQAALAPLPQLLELNINGSCSMAAAGPWLVQLTALTVLYARGCVLEEGDEMMYLPTGLQELCLTCVPSLQKLPSGLLRLQHLRLLDVSTNWKLTQLPQWLSQLRCLEALDLEHNPSFDEQPVLAQMPGLRRVRVYEADLSRQVRVVVDGQEVWEVRYAGAAAVYGQATHLHFGDVKRWQRFYVY
jgi:hypothetical protein